MRGVAPNPGHFFAIKVTNLPAACLPAGRVGGKRFPKTTLPRL